MPKQILSALPTPTTTTTNKFVLVSSDGTEKQTFTATENISYFSVFSMFFKPTITRVTYEKNGEIIWDANLKDYGHSNGYKIQNTLKELTSVLNFAPVIDSESESETKIAKEAEVTTFSITATDKDNDSLTYSLKNNPSWLTINLHTGVLTANPSGKDDTAENIIVSVTDGIANVESKAFTVEVEHIQGLNLTLAKPATAITPTSKTNPTTIVADFIQSNVKNLANTTIDAGAGEDTLTISDGGSVTIPKTISNIELLKLSNSGNSVDFLTSGVAFSSIQGGTGNDTLQISVNDLLNPIYQIDAGKGTDTLLISSVSATVQKIAVPTNLTNVEIIELAKSGNLELNSAMNIPTIKGSAGKDTISSIVGKDTVSGNAGNDTLNDYIFNGSSYSAGSGHNQLNGNGGNDSINAFAGYDTVNGNEGNDVINDSLLNGTLGVGHNEINGGTGRDTIWTAAGHNKIDAGSENDLIKTFYTKDGVAVENGNNTINGGDGDDQIVSYSGAGNTLTGGKGTDTFVYNAGGSVKIDTITDFSNDRFDFLSLLNDGFSVNFVGNVANLKEATSAITPDSNSLQVVYIKTLRTLQVDINDDGVFDDIHDLKILLNGVSQLSDADFV